MSPLTCTAVRCSFCLTLVTTPETSGDSRSQPVRCLKNIPNLRSAARRLPALVFCAFKGGRRHRGVLTERRGQPCAPSTAALPTIAQAPPGHHGRKWVSSDWLAVRLNPLAALRSHVSMTNLRGRVRAFPHSLPPRERNTWMDVGRLNIYLLRPRRAAGHWQRSQLLICRILYYLLGFVSFLFQRRLEFERLLLEVDLRTKLI